MNCLDPNFNDGLFEGEKEKDITLIDHARLDQIEMFAPLTGRVILNASTVTFSDIGGIFASPY